MSEHQGKKIKEFIEKHRDQVDPGASMDEIAKRLGIVRNTLYYHFGKKEVDLNFIKLLNDKGYPYNPEKPNESNAKEVSHNHNNKNIIYVPHYAYGGFLQGYSNKVFMDSLDRFSLPGITGEHYAFQIQGDSMMPYAAPGDLVISRKEEKLEWMIKGRPYVVQSVDGIIFKRYMGIKDGQAYFVSTNEEGSSPVLPLKEIKGVYLVVKVLKDFVINNH